MRLTREEVVERFCRLQSKVAHHLNDWHYASDCFCPDKKGDPEVYRNDGRALAFIEEAVTAAMTKRDGEFGELRPDIGRLIEDTIDDLRHVLAQLGRKDDE
jgi:hypothetical protein